MTKIILEGLNAVAELIFISVCLIQIMTQT